MTTTPRRPDSRRMQQLKKTFRETSAAKDSRCWICGMLIDYTAPHNDYKNRDRFQLDHYYPTSTHPALHEDPANFRPSHAGCNETRSNNMPRPGIGQTSRQWTQ